MKKYILIILIIFSMNAFGDTLNSFGGMSYININKTLSPRYDLTLYHYDIFSFANQKFAGKKYHAGDNQTYFQTALTYRYLSNFHFALGYIYSRNDPFSGENFENEHRIFQQVVYSKGYRTFKLNQRVRFEERFIDNRSHDRFDLRTRLRYQASVKTTLRPATATGVEIYSHSYNELYFSTSGSRNAFFSGDWLYSGIGLGTQNWGSLELGPLVQYSVVNTDKDKRFFYVLQFGWLIKF